MQPLQYKNIGREEHLTFDSIRRLVFHQLSERSKRKARQHIADCYRCQGIYKSLTRPAEVRKTISGKRTRSKLFTGVLKVMALIGLSASFLHFGGLSNLNFFDLSNLFLKGLSAMEKQITTKQTPELPDITTDDFKEPVTDQVLETIDTLAVVSLTDTGSTAAIKQFNTRPETETPVETEEDHNAPAIRGIYGKITANGEALKGVTVMVPGGNTAKLSDSSGKYYIQVPRNVASLVFIYRGKQLLKELDPTSRRRDVNLEVERMIYPEIETQEASSNIVSN